MSQNRPRRPFHRRRPAAPRLVSALLLGLGAMTLALVGSLHGPNAEAGPDPDEAVAPRHGSLSDYDLQTLTYTKDSLREGRRAFRFDTFGDEAFWGDALRLHEAVATVSPTTALAVGLKVDSDALPKELIDALLAGEVDLEDPEVTLELLRLDSVVGATGFFEGEELVSFGIQCALCHSTVDDSILPGIGRRRDGWANRDLDVGAIISLAPDLSPFTELLGVDRETVLAVLASWGPGKFDASLSLDGKAFRDDGGSAAVLIPPAFGLAGSNLHTWTGWGSVTHWNALVAVLEMHGDGTFIDPRLDDPVKFPIAAANGFAEVRSETDRVSEHLPALHLYQLALPAPTPPSGSFDAEAAARGSELFSGKAQCAQCHVPPLYTEPGWNLHTPEEMGIDSFQAERSPAEGYRTAPLAGLWTHTQGGFYHDGRFETLGDVLAHYEALLDFTLTPSEREDLEQFLLSL